MAGFQKIDPKQLPQVIGLGVASAGLFGYFAFKMIGPTASAAPAVAPASQSPAPNATAAPAKATAGSSADPAPATDAPPPSSGMRNPFVPLIGTALIATTAPTPAAPTQAPPVPAEAPPARVATADPSGGGAAVPAGYGPLPAMTPSLPSGPPSGGPQAGGVPGTPAPMPVAPPAPTWTVTGVLQSGTENVAILRDGDTRTFVHPGDCVGSDFRVVDVTRQFVVLRHGAQRYTLPLGGAKSAQPAPHAAATPLAGTPAPDSNVSTAGSSAPGGAQPPVADAPNQQQFQDIMQKLNSLTGGTPGAAPAPTSTAPGGVK